MEQGPLEAFLLDQARKQRAPIPEALLNAPELFPGSQFYYDAFLKLSSCRIDGMGMGRIPWTALNEFCKSFRMSAESRDSLWSIIQEMDAVYRDYAERKNKANSKLNKQAPAAGGLRSVKNING